ncbi:histidine kinase N-terminal 7TM domain-containing protein [Anaerovorax odorimutans]|uniref:histidine kinase N-terminal 7TM domain-containing protein n=1 Tax=Anaerovorax odorimutans TaxID=109327 RepID=UPI0009FBEA26|nr:histidine kinase N-terminal 7TM domain-containing protein [Anaerovorax odorimutans]
MQYQYTPYIWSLIASAFVTLLLGIYAFTRRKNAKGAMGFMLSMITLTLWSCTNALEMSAVDLTTKLFWSNMQYFAYCYSPVTLLALCMEFTGYDRWIKNKKILFIAVVPTIIIFLVWTNGLHGLMRYDIHMDYSGLFPTMGKKYGYAFYVHAIYSHVLNLLAWVLLIKAVFLNNTVYRKQAAALFWGLSLIIVPNMMYILGFGLSFDLTPVFFGPSGMIAAWGIFRYKLFEVIPVARATVIETMDAGVMVLDLQNRILDINPALERIVGYTASAACTKLVGEVCHRIPEIARACVDRATTHGEFSININGEAKTYEILLSPLTDKKNIFIGRLAVIYDITEKKLEQQEYLKQQQKLAATEERERLARDMHDNLGQVLGFINLQAQGIRQELTKADVNIVTSKLDKLVTVTQSAHEEIREYIRKTRNTEFMKTDFIEVLKKDILNFERQWGIRAKQDFHGGLIGEKIKTNIQVNILNIVKEALNNIGKHAKAKNVCISLLFSQGQLSIIIEDDGEGFIVGSYQNNKDENKFGLNIMRERAAEIGAQISIESMIGMGSRVTLCFQVRRSINEINAGR